MAYKYVCKESVKKKYDANGCSCIELELDKDFPDIQELGIHFYRYNLKAGSSVWPKLRADSTVVLMFNGKRAYVEYNGVVYHVTEPSFFIPDYDKKAYSVGAVEDCEFIMGVFKMSDWDWKSYLGWHKHLPFFKPYTEGVRYDQDCKKPGTCSWSILQGLQLGHVTIGVVRAIGAGTDEKGHPEVHQWNYCLGNSDFTLDVEGETVAHKAGDFSFVYAGKDHKLLAKPNKEVFYVWVEQYTDKDLDPYWTAYTHNTSVKEVYAELQSKKEAE